MGTQDSSSALLNDIESRWDDYKSHLDLFYSLALHHPPKARRFYEDTLEHEISTLRARSLTLQELNFAAFQTAKLQAKNRAKQSTLGVMLVAAVALAVGLIGSYAISRRAIQPLRDLTDSVKELKAGHLDTHIPIHGADEIADLGFEFNRMTERLRAFEEMNVNEIVREKQKSEAIIESIDDPLLLFDAEGRLLHLNKAAEVITGHSHESALGRSLSDLFRSKDVRRNVEHAIERAAKELVRPAATLEEMISAAPPIVSLTSGGHTRHFRIRVARIVAGQNGGSATREMPVAGVLVLFTDITHFKELDQMKSDFIAKVSHEFRTPLTSMTMSLDILGDELVGALNREQHDIIDTSKDDARRLSKLIRDLLTLSRLESSADTKATEEVIDVQQATEQLVRSMQPMYRERKLRLDVDGMVSGRFKITQEHYVSVLSNLLSNALKYTPSGGSVSISTKWNEQTSELSLIVRDTGVGIAPADQERIFEKFVQIKHRDSSTPGSVGLGLAIVREIAARYGGRVELESAVGKGSAFTVRFRVERIPVSEPAITISSQKEA